MSVAARHVQARKPHATPVPVQLCARCADPIQRLAAQTSVALGLDTAWLDSLEAVDHEALGQLRSYLHQLAVLWWWTHWALDGAARGKGIEEVRTHQRGGDPVGIRITDGDAPCPECGEVPCQHQGLERAGPTWDEPPRIADTTWQDNAAEELRRRCRAEVARLHRAGWNLQRYLARLELAVSPNFEREQRMGLRDTTGRLVS